MWEIPKNIQTVMIIISDSSFFKINQSVKNQPGGQGLQKTSITDRSEDIREVSRTIIQPYGTYLSRNVPARWSCPR